MGVLNIMAVMKQMSHRIINVFVVDLGIAFQ